jgi:hypothetical protein
MSKRNSADDQTEILRLLRQSRTQLRLAAGGALCRSQRSSNPMRWIILWSRLRVLPRLLDRALAELTYGQEGEKE